MLVWPGVKLSIKLKMPKPIKSLINVILRPVEYNRVNGDFIYL